MSKGSSQQNCNLPILLRLCKSGSTMIIWCVTCILQQCSPVRRYSTQSSF